MTYKGDQMSEVITKKRVAEITGLKLRAVQYYTERGIVTPDIDPGEGRGNLRRYGPRNLVEFSLIKVLTEYGMGFSYLKNIMDHVTMLLFPDREGTSIYRKGMEPDQENGPYLAIYKLSNGQISPDEPSMGALFDVVDYKKMDKASSVLVINLIDIFRKSSTIAKIK